MILGMDDTTTNTETTSIKRDRGGQVVIGGTWQTQGGTRPRTGRPSNVQVS